MGKYDEVSVVRQLNNVGAVIGINPASKVIKVAKVKNKHFLFIILILPRYYFLYQKSTPVKVCNFKHFVVYFLN